MSEIGNRGHGARANPARHCGAAIVPIPGVGISLVGMNPVESMTGCEFTGIFLVRHRESEPLPF
jgi:hypothetical protein